MPKFKHSALSQYFLGLDDLGTTSKDGEPNEEKLTPTSLLAAVTDEDGKDAFYESCKITLYHFN